MKARALGMLILSLPLNFSLADPVAYPASQSILPDGRICMICKMPDGDVSTATEPASGHAGFLESKVVDKNGKILQWYQSFLDSNGHEILYIGRKSPGNRRSYAGIEDIVVRTYNFDGNVNEEYVYWGDGTFRSHIVNVYSKETKKWIRDDAYSSTGVFLSSNYTPNEEFIYGEKKQNSAPTGK
jgi:hypothetical protein